MLERLTLLGRVLRIHAVITLILSLLLYTQGLMALVESPRPAWGNQHRDWIFSLVQFGNGTLFLVLAGVFSLAYWRLQELRSRGLILFAIYINALLIFTCLLAMTGLPLLIIGSLTMHHEHVCWAFQQVRQGRSAAEVRATRLRYGDERDDYDDDHLGP